MNGLLGLLGIFSLTSGTPSISSINGDGRFSVKGGARLTLSGSGFAPAGWELGSAASLPVANIVSMYDGSITQPCTVIAHLLSDDQLVCDVGELVIPRSLMRDDNDGNFKVQITVDGQTSGMSGAFRFTQKDSPKIWQFEQNEQIVPKTVSGSWSAWINDDVVDGSAATETESLRSFIESGGCPNPIMIEVKDVASGRIFDEDDLLQGWNDCACTGGIYTGLKCAVPAEDAGKFTCTADHAIRYYCSDANVIGFGMDTDLSDAVSSPGLFYLGAKYAECETSWIDLSGQRVKVFNAVDAPNTSYDFFRCQLAWSSNSPRVGNYMFKFETETEGTLGSRRNAFMGSDGQFYNIQVRPQIDSVSPQLGASVGGAKLTVTGQNLNGVTDIRVGGVACTSVEASSDGTTATCITPAEPAECALGDAPVDGVNCANWLDVWQVNPDTAAFTNYATNWKGEECTNSCVPDGGNVPRCLNRNGDNWFCYIPNCQNYERMYPGSPGLDFTWTQDYARIDQTYHLANNFGVSGLSDGDNTNPVTSDVFSSTYYNSNYRAGQTQVNDQFYGTRGRGFFKPPMSGYYTMVVTTCDDTCLLQISTVGGMGCAADLKTFGLAEGWNTNVLGRDEMSGTYRTQKKVFLSSDEQYYMNFYHHNANGGDFAEFGYIYHGTDEHVNMNIAGISVNDLDSLVEAVEVKEQTQLEIENTGSEEQQRFNLTTDQPFQILICPSDDAPDADCARTENLEVGMDGSDAQAALESALESQCSTMGFINTDMGVHFNMEHSNGFGGQTFYSENYDGFCGQRRVLVAPQGTQNVLYSMWIGKNINEQRGIGLKVKNNRHVCFGIKGFADYLSFYTNQKTAAKDSHEWWWTAPVAISSSSTSWSFACIDIIPLIEAQMASRPNEFPDPSQYNPLDWTIKHLQLGDTQSRGRILVDEIFIGTKSSTFNILQTKSGVVPGAVVDSFDVSGLKNGGGEFNVKMQAGRSSCGTAFSHLRADLGNGNVVQAQKVSSIGNGLSGSFNVVYNGNYATVFIDWLNDNDQAKIKQELFTRFGDDFGDLEVSITGSCSAGYDVKLTWNLSGDFASVSLDETGLNGDMVTSFVRQFKHGGMLFRTMTDAHLSLPFSTPQVQAWSGDVQAVCAGDCSFAYTDTGMPVVDSVSLSTLTTSTQVSIVGTDFNGAVSVMIGDYTAEIVSSSPTQLDITCNTCCAGNYDIVVLNDIGQSNAISVTIVEEISSVSPSNVNAGDTITIAGSGFCASTSVAVGGIDCVVSQSSSTEVMCTVANGVGTHDVAIGSANTMSVTVDNASLVCSIDSSYSPVYTDFVGVTCNMALTNVNMFVDGLSVMSSSDPLGFTKPLLSTGTYTVVVTSSESSTTASLTVDFSVSGISNVSGGRLGMGVLELTGSNLNGASVTVGGRQCQEFNCMADFACHVPSLSSADVTMSITSASAVEGAFTPSSITVEAGSRVTFEWDVNVADGTLPTMSIGSAGTFQLSTVEGNQGQQHYVFMEQGSYTISTGLFDGLNEIIGTVIVTEPSASVDADIVVMVGDEQVDLSAASVSNTCQAGSGDDDASVYSYRFNETVVFDSASVVGNTVSVSSSPEACIATLQVNGVCCMMSNETSCAVDVPAGVYDVSVDNMVAASSDADDVTFDVSVTTDPMTISGLGGATVSIQGANLAGVSDVVFAGCEATDVSYSAPFLQFTMAVGCGTIASNVDVELDGTTFATQISTGASGFGTYTFVSATASTVEFTVEGAPLSGEQNVIAYYQDLLLNGELINCGAITLDDAAPVTVSCSFSSDLVDAVRINVGFESIGLAAQFNAPSVTPQLTSLSHIEGSHYGGNIVTITGASFGKSVSISHVIDGVDLCAAGCDVKTQDSMSLTYVTPATGSSTGSDEATVSVVANGLSSATATYTHRAAKTPMVTSVVRTDNSIRISLDKGVNADCHQMLVTIGNEACAITDCSAVKKSGMFLECDIPPLVAGSHSVMVTDPLTGDSDGVDAVSVSLTVTSFSPTTSGLAGGAPLTIIGEGMNPAATVTVCGQDCALVADRSNPSNIVCLIPSQVSSGTCSIVLNAARTGTNVGDINFDGGLTASVDGVTSSNGKIRGGTAGGTLLTLSGSNFNTDSTFNQVTIGGSDCVIQSATSTEIICQTTAHSGSGYFDIEIDVNGIGLFTAPTQFRYVNAWSSPATWGCSSGTFADCASAPTADGDLVEIGPGNDVLLDVSTVIMSALIIRGGSLTWDTDVNDIHLQAEYVVIVDGTFTLGTEDSPMMLQARITLYGHHRSIHLPIYGAKCFAVRSGTVDIHGAPVEPTWTFLDATAEAGANSITIQTPNGLTGWNVGDRIAIAPTGGKNSIVESEDTTISSIVDNGDGTHTLGLDDSLVYVHTGTETTWPGFNGEVTTLNQRAEVGLLSRNIKFEGSKNPSPWYDTIPECEGGELDLGLNSVQNCFVDRFNDEEGSDKFGAHMLFHSVTHAKVEFMEIHHCGQAHELGRYPIHFHNSYDQPDSYLRGLGIWQTFNRAMTLHAVNYALFENNVAYNNMGHAYFMEDGVEHDNIVRFNLAIKTKIASSLLSVDQTPTSFWIVNTNNRYYGNHAAGAAGFGFWINPPKHSTGSNVRNDFCPREIPVLEFRDNTAHSCGVYGMWIFEEYHPRKNNFDGVCGSDAGLAGADHPMENFVAWGNHRGVELTSGSGVHMNGFVAADNDKAQLSCKENDRADNYETDSSGYFDSIVIGHSDSHSSRTQCEGFGMETPWKKGSFQVSGIKFYNFDTVTSGCAAIDYCYGSYPFDCGRISLWDRVEWINSPRRGHFDWEFETVLWDLDGTLSGTGQPGRITPKSELYKNVCDDHTDGWDLKFPAMHCDDSAYFHRISIEEISPGSLNSVNLIVNNGNEARVPWREKRGDSGRAWMYLNLQDTPAELHWDSFYNMPNVTFALKTNYDAPGHYSALWFDLLDRPDLITGLTNELTAIPTLGDDNYGYFIDDTSGGDVWITLQSTDASVPFGPMERKWFETKKCWYPNCIIPNAGDPTPPASIVTCAWSDPSCWPSGVVPGLDSNNRENVTVVIDRHVILDVANIYVDDLYVEGTLELDQSAADDFIIEANNILVNTGKGGVNDFETSVILLEAAAAAEGRSFNDDNLPEWQYGRLLIGTEDNPIDCAKSVTIKLTAHDAMSRDGWGALSNSVPAGNKTIAAFGRMSMVGCGPTTNYMRLKRDAAKGQTDIRVDSVPADWVPGMMVVLSPSSAVETEWEVLTIASKTNSKITFTTPLQYNHAGYLDNGVQGSDFANAAEVGLLTRNIKIDGSLDGAEEYYGGRVLVASGAEDKIYRQGHATLSNIEFVGMGQYGMSELRDPRFALAFFGISDAANGKPTEMMLHEASGNEYQPAGYEIGASYVRHSSFHGLYGVAIGANQANGIDISNNVVNRAIDDGIKVGYSENVVIDGNMVVGVIDNVFYKELWKSQHNFDFDGVYMPTGIATIEEATVASMKNNAVSGVQGSAYTTWGEKCDASEVNTAVSVSTVSSNNIGHSSVYGVRPMFTQTNDQCSRYSGFSFTHLMTCGFCSILNPIHMIVENFEVQDTPVGVFFNNFGLQAVSHTVEDKTFTVKNSKFVAFTAAGEANNCNRDYLYKNANAPVGSMMETWGVVGLMDRHFINTQNKGATYAGNLVAFAWTNLQGGMHSYPHKSFDKPTKNMVLQERNYLNNVSFINYNSANNCGLGAHVVQNLPKQHDHHGQIDVSSITFVNTPDNNKFFLFEPQLEWINPSECVDMDCDGPKKAMLVDLDGSFSDTPSTGVKHTYMGISELDYGINGPRGLGDWRIPAVMLTNLDGSTVSPATWAPKHGVLGTHDSCTKNSANHYYKCPSLDYGQVMYESMDVDTETRRVAPIAYMSEGTVDIINGVLDTSCCAGYACQLRQTTHPLIMQCGKEYEVATTGTLNKDIKLHMLRQDPSCQIKLKLYTRRQNRQDVFIDGNLVLATNSFLDADNTLAFESPDASHLPAIGDAIGTNFFDRTEQLLHVNIGGNSTLRIIVAKTLVIEFDTTNIELTADELYDSENLRFYLASLLGLDISQIKVVNVVQESSDRRRRRRDASGFVVHSSRARRSGIDTSTIVLEIDTNSNQQSQSASEAANTDDVLTQNTNFAQTIIDATLNNELPADLELLPQVAVQTVTPPTVPDCMAEEVANSADPANAFDPTFIPGADCSLANFYNVTPEELPDVADTDSLSPYTDNTADEDTQLEQDEAMTSFKAPVGWEVAVEPVDNLDENVPMNPPLRLNLLDSDGEKIDSAGFLDATYTATITVASGTATVNSESAVAVTFDTNGQAVFDNLAFDGEGDVTLTVSLTQPGSTGLADYTVGPYTIIKSNADPDATAAPEEPCSFAADAIHCVANNMDTSTDLLMGALDAMNLTELGDIKWLAINQNTGINPDDLVPIMAKLYNLERLSLNSNAMWQLHPDTFNFNTKLSSISLHNNALTCLDGVFDNLIEKQILKRVRLTQNLKLSDEWAAEYRYRGDDEMQAFKALIDANLCLA